MELENLTQAEYEAHIANKTFRLAFVGMSNVGKSYRSQVLRDECGFMWYHVDEEIQKSLGFKAMDEISRWIGYPNSQGYAEREKTYLASEDKHTKVDFLDTNGKNLVFDTTGSVIYLQNPTLAWLKENCLVVNLDIDERAIDTMTKKFFEKPKPIAWSGFFKPNEGETEKETLERCYPELLADRLKKYRALSHINIPAEKLYDRSGSETLDVIKTYLKK
ncbi:hypothetical protein A3F27_03085 [Candidatus Kaiserbacteria bacterium RIFCSPHIGHO2_12_FULL_53_13]|uniref:Shikimate kinase n=1 Tax=Candidatus Kaiserbacteria bacterium RIFCSPHIGHO2_12_FULL_53_13 TaxID=1798502 RepID=A0A1F6EA90_9BACT|nr:MAG: hypothetical protein A3F27_03085 [Candidatus Kaiserbacteria bacterium RIFCSPHIGHO2_12_FULL_53_13]OGG74501.1 MAG: hypothetical protein A3A37_02850 [Candidatus Kaiserbacteria bacterium RIFCSPLOWO2_01_FULL_52_36]